MFYENVIRLFMDVPKNMTFNEMIHDSDLLEDFYKNALDFKTGTSKLFRSLNSLNYSRNQIKHHNNYNEEVDYPFFNGLNHLIIKKIEKKIDGCNLEIFSSS